MSEKRFDDIEEGNETEELLESLRQGDDEAWKWLLKTYDKRLRGYFHNKILGLSYADQTPLVEEVIDRLLKEKATLGKKGELRNFIFLIAHGVSVDYLRKIIRRQGVERDRRGEVVEKRNSEAEQVIQDQVRKSLLELFKKYLSPYENKVMIGHYLEGKSYKELAHELRNTTEDAVKQQAVRARERLLNEASDELRDLLDALSE